MLFTHLLTRLRCSSEKDKVDAIEVIMISALSSGDENVTQKFTNFITEHLRSLKYETIKELDEIITKSEDNYSEIKKHIVIDLWENVVNRGVTRQPDERIKDLFKYCFDNRQDTINIEKIKTAIKAMYSTVDKLSFWQETIQKYSPAINSNFPEEICSELLNIIKTVNDIDYMDKGAGLFLSLISLVPSYKSNPMISIFMNYVHDEKPNLRKIAVKYLLDFPRKSGHTEGLGYNKTLKP